MDITVFNSDGKIIDVRSIPEIDLDFALENGGAGYIEGHFDPFKFYVANGVAAAISEQPTANHVWDWAAKAWVDPRTLQQLRDAKWEEIKLQRQAAFDAPLVTPHGTFDSDEKSRANIANAVSLVQTLVSLGEPQDTDFTLADNSVVTLTPSQMVEVGLQLGAKVQAIYAASRVLRTAIYAASELELDSIQWPAL